MAVPVFLPTEEVGCCINTKKNVLQPSNLPPDPSPSQEIKKTPDLQPEKNKTRKKKKKKRTEVITDSTTEPPEVASEPSSQPEICLAAHPRKNKRRRRKRQNRRTAAVPSVPPSTPGKSPNYPIPLLGFLMYLSICSATNCTVSVPVSDFPIVLHQGNQTHRFSSPTFCPLRVPIFGSCSACFEDKSLLQIIYIVTAEDIRVEHGKGHGDSAIVSPSLEDCTPFVEKGPTETPDEERPNTNQKEKQKDAEEKLKAEESEDVTSAGTKNGESFLNILGVFLLGMFPVGCLMYVIKSARERHRLGRRTPTSGGGHCTGHLQTSPAWSREGSTNSFKVEELQ